MSDFKAPLNDKMIQRLAPADKGEQYVVTDTDLRGFFLKVGVAKKTFMVRGEFWRDGKRATKKVALGSADEISTREARVLAKAELAKIAKGEFVEKATPTDEVPNADITLRQAWARYRMVLERKNRSSGTIASYGDHIERQLKDWLDKPLKELGDAPGLVARRHARKSVRGLPAENPVRTVDWNEEQRRDVAMGKMDLPGWMVQAGRLRNPIRREFHLFTLLSGSRPTALKTAKIANLNLRARILHIPTPKGGKKKAFDIELSRPMIRCLIRAMRTSRMLHPEAAETWIFAAGGEEGHIVEQKESRDVLSKWGNDLRHTYRTIGQEVLLSPIDMHLLMNHSVKKDVNTGYITRSKLSDHLRASQQALSDFMIAAGAASPKSGGKRERVWPLLPSRRIGDHELDPTPLDPRVGQPWSEENRRMRVAAKLARAA